MDLPLMRAKRGSALVRAKLVDAFAQKLSIPCLAAINTLLTPPREPLVVPLLWPSSRE